VIEQAFRAMQTVIPATQGSSLARRWGGLVDMSPDSLPIIDHVEGPDGCIVVAGLSGHGLALGPVIGEITAELALERATSRPIAPFRLARFREGLVANPEKVM
jgi:sarcosine oxidase, subunit beta